MLTKIQSEVAKILHSAGNALYTPPTQAGLYTVQNTTGPLYLTL